MAEPYENPLVLTTPHMRGTRVKNAQWLLAGHNVFHDNDSPIHTYYGRIDGVYGESSAGATKRAKFWLGYPTSQIDGHFGTFIYNLLHGDSHLSAEYAERRQRRLKAAASTERREEEGARAREDADRDEGVAVRVELPEVRIAGTA